MNPIILTDVDPSHESSRRQRPGRSSADSVELDVGQEVLDGSGDSHMVDAKEAATAEAEGEVAWVDDDGLLPLLEGQMSDWHPLDQVLTHGDSKRGRRWIVCGLFFQATDASSVSL